MKVSRNGLLNPILMILLLGQIILPKGINFCVVILIFLFLLYKNKCLLYTKIPGLKMYFLLIAIGVTSGIFNLSMSGHSGYIMLKQLYYCSMPFLYSSIGCMLINFAQDENNVFNCILNATVLCTIYDLLNSSFVLLTKNYSTLHQLRSLIGGGSIYPIISLYLLLFFDQIHLGKTKFKIICGLSVLSILIHFSRTFLLELLVLLVFSGTLKRFGKTVKIVIVALCGVLMVYCLSPEMFNSFAEKILYATTELNINNTDWNYVSINHNWRGYELYCELAHFRNAGLFEQMFGGGFGSTLDVFNYAYLVTDEEYLVFMHNGYGNVLMIWGVLGIILYISWILMMYRKANNIHDKKLSNFLKGLSVVILIVSYFIMGPLFSEAVAIYLLFYSMLYRTGRRKEKNVVI